MTSNVYLLYLCTLEINFFLPGMANKFSTLCINQIIHCFNYTFVYVNKEYFASRGQGYIFKY